MAEKTRPLTLREIAHVVCRGAMAVGIGWSYLWVVSLLDIGGWATWIRVSAWGPVVKAELLALVTVAFGAVGLHVGMTNVMGDRVRMQRARLRERRAAMRRWENR